MSRSARRRLQAAINRLALRPHQTAKSDRGLCCFCANEVRSGDGYRSSGTLKAHAVCVAAVGADLRIEDTRP